MEWWLWRENRRNSERDLLQSHFVYNESHTNQPALNTWLRPHVPASNCCRFLKVNWLPQECPWVRTVPRNSSCVQCISCLQMLNSRHTTPSRVHCLFLPCLHFTVEVRLICISVRNFSSIIFSLKIVGEDFGIGGEILWYYNWRRQPLLGYGAVNTRWRR
jgi:hypothetical protein